MARVSVCVGGGGGGSTETSKKTMEQTLGEKSTAELPLHSHFSLQSVQASKMKITIRNKIRKHLSVGVGGGRALQ